MLGQNFSDSLNASTLTPLSATILENTITTGIGYHWKRHQFDFGYQYDLPSVQNIGTSSLQSGEYSNSTIKIRAQEFALLATVNFWRRPAMPFRLCESMIG